MVSRDADDMHEDVSIGRYCRLKSLRPKQHAPEVVMATKDEGGQKRATRQSQDVEEVEDAESSDVQERHEKLSEDVDDILDEIDSVLEENAEDFVRGYVQKGGE